MKTKDLIKELQKIDPDGECEVFGTGGDIYFLQRLPWNYDGKPGILVRDESKNPFYNIVGMRQITKDDGDKIYLQEIALEDVIGDGWEHFNELILSGDERFMEMAKKYRDKMEAMHQDIEKKAFINWGTKKFLHSYGDQLHDFYITYEKQLDRLKDFSSFGSSLRDKSYNYWNDCVKWDENLGHVVYVEGFENKNYNPPKKNE